MINRFALYYLSSFVNLTAPHQVQITYVRRHLHPEDQWPWIAHVCRYPWRAEVSPLLIYRCEGLQHAFAYVSRSLAWCMNVLVEWCHLWCLKATGQYAVQQLHVPKPFTLRIRSTSSVAARSVLLIACHQG